MDCFVAFAHNEGARNTHVSFFTATKHNRTSAVPPRGAPGVLHKAHLKFRGAQFLKIRNNLERQPCPSPHMVGACGDHGQPIQLDTLRLRHGHY
jgi:hypothetical protein